MMHQIDQINPRLLVWQELIALERPLFEVWAREHEGLPIYWVDEYGHYRGSATGSAWHAWLVRAAMAHGLRVEDMPE